MSVYFLFLEYLEMLPLRVATGCVLIGGGGVCTIRRERELYLRSHGETIFSTAACA